MPLPTWQAEETVSDGDNSKSLLLETQSTPNAFLESALACFCTQFIPFAGPKVLRIFHGRKTLIPFFPEGVGSRPGRSAQTGLTAAASLLVHVILVRLSSPCLSHQSQGERLLRLRLQWVVLQVTPQASIPSIRSSELSRLSWTILDAWPSMERTATTRPVLNPTVEFAHYD